MKCIDSPWVGGVVMGCGSWVVLVSETQARDSTCESMPLENAVGHPSWAGFLVEFAPWLRITAIEFVRGALCACAYGGHFLMIVSY